MYQCSTPVPVDFSSWKARVPALSSSALRLLAISPFERPDLSLARAALRHGAAVALNIGRDPAVWVELMAALGRFNSPHAGVCIPDHLDISPEELPQGLGFVVLSAERDLASWIARWPVVVQVCSVDEARAALAAGAAGLIAKGQESGGLVGDESSFILLQRIIALDELAGTPVWCQGGIGLHTAAGAIAAGAFGVVLDSQLALLGESSLPAEIRQAVQAMDGSETRCIGGYQLYSRPGLPIAEACADLSPAQVRENLGCESLQQFLCIGQDAALAKPLAAQCPNMEALLHSIRTSIVGHIRQARALQSLAANSPLAQAHGTRYPIAQGPMTRVSDTAAFAISVAENGALPFLALSLMQAPACRSLLEQTRASIGERAWGVGVLGFAPAEVLDPQLALISEFKPSVVLLAGGRPSQARALQEQGIPAYLHVPSPGLLELFLKDGARHFVFEGRECGGHVGPRFSFVLWEQQVQILLGVERAEELHILFAGGIHDARSAAMVAAIAAPLAARGAKIGVLMGSAYIATEEAVSCDAVIEHFQRRVLAGEGTVLLETAPGHATRCLQSGFVELFEAEKRRLQKEGLDPKAIWQRLEDLNVGRLRVASKGVDRKGDELVQVDLATQDAEGMYMIGQLATMCRQVQSMAALHGAVSEGASAVLAQCELPSLERAKNAEPIAVVGMECIYPGSPDLESFWANILEGRDLVTEVPAERWNVDTYYQSGQAGKGKTPSKWGGFIADTPFDPLAYGIPPQSLAAIEPVQLLSLEVARRALLNAGYDVDGNGFDREKTSVIFGAESGMDLSNGYCLRNVYPQYLGELPAELDAVLPDLTEDSFPGILVNVISGRIANRLGLSGVNYSVDSACASSLTAIELAVKELRAGSSDMVLAGGADFHNSINDFLMFASVKALSASGRCRSFDNSADGICLGEGVGVVVLKRLSDAERDGDRIYAVIEGVAGSSDGKGLGLTAPRKEGQKRALERTYWQAGVLAADIGLVEAHGTGTVVGDRTELQTLTEIFNAGGGLPGQAGLGSVKSQIGHTKCAAGIAGLIKISKALYHRVLPPTQNIVQPNAWYRPETSPFMLNNTPQPWLQPQPLAAVSAFGFGGANFHAVLSAPPASQMPATGVSQWPAELFVFRGASAEAARQQMQRLAEFVRQSDAPLRLRDLSFTVAQEGEGEVQCCVVAHDLQELGTRLSAAIAGQASPGVHLRQADATGRVAFLFPGQGSQSPGMLQDIFVAFPQLHHILRVGSPWVHTLYPPTAYGKEQQRAQQAAITDTRVAQPTLGMADYAMASLLHALGFTPEMSAGHSYGELVALATAGCMDLSTLLSLSGQRGEAMLAAAGADPGKMAAVSAGMDVLAEVLKEHPEVVPANQNSPAQTVISGPSNAVEEALVALKARGIAAQLIQVACAFHSPVVAKAEQLFAERLRSAELQAPGVAVYSNTTAELYPTEPDAIRERLARHIVSPVRFVEQIERMYADGARVFVEVGPGRVLSALVQKILNGKPHRMVATDQKGKPGIPSLLEALAQLAVATGHIDQAVLFQGRGAERVELSAPRKLSPTCWMINGARAWPRQGALPAHAGKVLMQPLAIAGGGARPVVDQAGEEHAVIHYLNSVREIVHAQRDVMLGFLGQPSVSVRPSTGQVSRGVVLDAVAQAPIPAPASAAPAAVSVLDTKTTLLAIVSDRTGYPADMLDLDLDLEADLSIDSIKRVEIIGELSERLGVRQLLGGQADKMLEQLATQKTLRAILAWLGERLPAGAPVTAAAPVAVQSAPARDPGQVLLAIVSDRTGYPADVLDLDLDLEADLSIDSIKRLEIVGELSEQLGLAQMLASKDATIESLAALKTLRAMTDWLAAHTGATVAEAKPAATAAAPEADDMVGPPPLSRYVLHTVAAPDVVSGDHDLAGKRFLITDDGHGIAERLARRLERHSAHVRIIGFGEDEPFPEDLPQLDGLIHLWVLNPDSRVRDVKRFFDLAREALMHKASYLLVAGGLGGDFGHYRGRGGRVGDDFGRGAGLAGMVKTVVKEWPGLRAHWIDLDLSEPVDTLATYLELELLADNPLVEVGYRAGSRQRVDVVHSNLSTDGVDQLALDRDSVVLLTGGARGITARLAISLARRYQCQLELVGRSALPQEAETASTLAAQDIKALRQVLIAEHPELRPADVEKRCAKIMGAREIRQTFAEIEAAGGRVNYSRVDVRDIHAFSDFIQGLYQKYGHIDGVIHGAGVVEDKLARHKTAESFQRVFDTKVRGALMLFKLIRDDVKFVVFFSSVAGAFGNRGQVDYASANDVLDKISHALQSRVQGRVLSVNWGPWAGTGMVSKELEREYARKGIGLIPLDEGVDALLQELQFGSRDEAQVVLMCATPAAMGMIDEAQ